jgi:hypothetical protein
MTARGADQSDLFDEPRRPRAYPARPGFKAAGPSTAAAETIAPFAPTLRGRALAELRKSENRNGLTADEIATALISSEFAMRPRLSELKRSGEVIDSGHRRPNKSGINATVWRIKPTTIEELTEFQAAQQFEAVERARAPSTPQPSQQASNESSSNGGTAAH